MFKKLRNRFMLYIMAVLTVVMVTALVATYLLVSANVQLENERRLDAEVQSRQYEHTHKREPVYFVELVFITEDGSDSINCLSAQLMTISH